MVISTDDNLFNNVSWSAVVLIYPGFSWTVIFLNVLLTHVMLFLVLQYVFFCFCECLDSFLTKKLKQTGFKTFSVPSFPSSAATSHANRASVLLAGKLAPRHATNLHLHGDYFRRDILKSSGRWRVLWKIAVLLRQEEAGVEKFTYSWMKCVCDRQSSEPLASVRQLCTSYGCYKNDETFRVLRVWRDNAE